MAVRHFLRLMSEWQHIGELLRDHTAYALLGWAAVMSLITYLAYSSDKQKAQMGEWRTSEQTLLLLGFLGGTIGAIVAMTIHHHKTRKLSFQAKFAVLTGVQIVAIVVLLGSQTRRVAQSPSNSIIIEDSSPESSQRRGGVSTSDLQPYSVESRSTPRPGTKQTQRAAIPTRTARVRR